MLHGQHRGIARFRIQTNATWHLFQVRWRCSVELNKAASVAAFSKLFNRLDDANEHSDIPVDCIDTGKCIRIAIVARYIAALF